MVAIINGGSNDDGDISFLGHGFNYNYHAECLIDYALHKYPNISGFEKIDYMNEPNLPLYYLSILNNIIFTNISVDDEKRGMLYLPREISDKQLQTLLKFMDSISDFKTTIVRELLLIDGTVFGKDLDVSQKEDTKEEVKKYILKKQYLKREGRI